MIASARDNTAATRALGGCGPEPPDFLATVPIIEQGRAGDPRFGFVRSDESVVAVGLCTEPGAPPPMSVLRAGTVVEQPFGGAIAPMPGNRSTVVSLFPYVGAGAYAVLDEEGGELAAFHVPSAPHHRCPDVTVEGSATLETCAAIYVARVLVAPSPRGKPDLIEGDVFGPDGTNLGFYLMGAEPSSTGLAVRVGFVPPPGASTFRIKVSGMIADGQRVPTPPGGWQEVTLNIKSPLH